MDVGSEIQLQHETWSFADTIEHFDRHILQSIPNCQAQRDYIATLARFFLHAQAQVVEIGVSTGALARAVLERTPERPLTYLGIDVEPQMVAAARRNLAHDSRFSALEANVADVSFESPALVISYYTLQFIPQMERIALTRRIYEALEPGGAMILYEKTLGENARVQDMMTQLYYDFKAAQGLSPEAILNKAVALRGVSMPLSLEGNRQLLLDAGFNCIELLYRDYCFAGFLAVK
ncbi:MAG: methyltransferase [Candidatus Melainabacteria bacterium HGW-Melainabacteria-1]|nr:MAG: methyltransferase [Candidatus Melainabacteria bacterium HGW-Melainabacteria-1]